MGSVKDLEIIRKPEEKKPGKGIFIFSNRYSVFDYGEMPDHIPNKGAALCMMAAWNFERLEEQGINTHYLGVLDSSERLSKTYELKEPSNRMVIKLSRVIEPEFKNRKYDYSFFTKNREKVDNFVVPLENIYRRGVPKGSSLLRTIDELEKQGKTKELEKIFSKYGLKEKPNPGELFPKIGYDFTTKFEPSDRKLTNGQAYKISGLTKEQFKELENLRNRVAEFVGKRAEQTGLVDFDGKHEYVFFNGILLADVVGTFDENRFMLGKEQVSKEYLRQYHKKHQSKWYKEVERAKKQSKQQNIKNWKSLVETPPKKLPSRLVNLIGEMYASGSDRYTELNLFKTRSLEKVMEELKRI